MNIFEFFNKEILLKVQTINIDGKQLFCFDDIKNILHCEDNFILLCKNNINYNDKVFVPESDIYRLLYFLYPTIDYWIMEELLPTIRKTGKYIL